MLKFICLFLIISTSAFARTPIIEKHASSGYVMPEHRFVKNCAIMQEGYMETMITTGDGRGVGNSQILTVDKIAYIEFLIKLASKGKIEESPMPCDIGTVTVYAKSGDEEVIIEEGRDCGVRKMNKSFAAKKLREMVTEICRF